jgi:pimeloyl-ACP methyl ester carboxylesterase
MPSQASTVDPPSKALWAREVVAVAELGAYLAALPWYWLTPRGDGHPVMVLPGLIQTDLSTQPLRSFLASRGYKASRWGLGRNKGRANLVEASLLPRLQALHAEQGRKVSIIGWSMGGLYARELARRAPELVRQVITLGSPFAGPAKASNAWRVYEMLSGEKAGDPEIGGRFEGPLQVPTSSIYSRNDGIVAWQACLNPPGAQAENIEVGSTHFGLGHHPAVLHAVADRLAQPEGRWRPFAPQGMARHLFPTHSAVTPTATMEFHT